MNIGRVHETEKSFASPPVSLAAKPTSKYQNKKDTALNKFIKIIIIKRERYINAFFKSEF